MFVVLRYFFEMIKQFSIQNNTDQNSILYYCYSVDSLGWQLGCLIATYLFLFVQHSNNQYTTVWDQFYKTHCKCFYIKKNIATTTTTTSLLSPPSYKDICETGLPSYYQCSLPLPSSPPPPPLPPPCYTKN